jgi:acyl-CoA synthetase (AMP-forming)/AMP-acid ligase II
VRVDEYRAAEAYRRGLWVHSTLADSLRDAAHTTPGRTVLVDGDIRLDCQTLHERASTLAHTLLARMPPGSVVSFMLPNWHEAAVIYLAATLAGMVVNPVLPSLRDRELQFILSDANSRAIFIPAEFGKHDYVAMLDRVTAAMASPPEVVVLRGDERSLPLEKSPKSRAVRNVRRKGEPGKFVAWNSERRCSTRPGTSGN